ncbi:hypothetical protein, partial [uncultured Sphingomonas sp.]|uniref:hypothetical protein n=1 Tax=uncultured Sphingomonas sp. TaxID=158754 RepID=UPI0035CC3AA9
NPSESAIALIRKGVSNYETLTAERTDYDGFHTRPMSWDDVVAKFDRLAALHAGEDLRRQIVELVRDVERHSVADMMTLLARTTGGETLP